LGHVAFPNLFLDATRLKVRDPDLHQVVSKRSWWPRGSPPTATVEVLGLAVGDSEPETSWAEFLLSLRNPGLGGVRLVFSHAHDGPTQSSPPQPKGGQLAALPGAFHLQRASKSAQGLGRHGRCGPAQRVRAP
jgi:hypothetical protein